MSSSLGADLAEYRLRCDLHSSVFLREWKVISSRINTYTIFDFVLQGISQCLITVRLGLLSREESSSGYSNSTGFAVSSVCGIGSKPEIISPMRASDTEVGTSRPSSPVDLVKVNFASVA